MKTLLFKVPSNLKVRKIYLSILIAFAETRSFYSLHRICGVRLTKNQSIFKLINRLYLLQ